MSRASIQLIQVSTSEQVEMACRLFREYSEAIGTDLEYQGFNAELDALPEPYVPPKGALLIARNDAEVAGCVALRPIDTRAGEMKRLYVRPEFRSSGLGRRLVEAVTYLARAAGYAELRLDTLPNMSSAQALYRQLGFIEIPPYNSKHLPGTRFFTLSLSGVGPGSARF